MLDMTGGWFTGSFTPAAHSSELFEAAVKRYSSGDKEPVHHHKLATEITVIVTGKVKMCGKIWDSGSIIVLDPNESTDFLCVEDSITFVIKTPSVQGDKYLGP